MYKRFIHEKNCWTVTLYSDGSIVAYSNYKVRTNIAHVIPANYPLAGSYGLIPDYVFNMLLGARYEWEGK